MGDLVLTDKFIKPNCEKEYPGTGNFSCVDGYFMMEREIGYYVTYAFLPSLMTWLLHSVYGGYHKIKHFACHRDFFVHQIPRIKHTQNASLPGIKHFRASHWLKIGSIIENVLYLG